MSVISRATRSPSSGKMYDFFGGGGRFQGLDERGSPSGAACGLDLIQGRATGAAGAGCEASTSAAVVSMVTAASSFSEAGAGAWMGVSAGAEAMGDSCCCDSGCLVLRPSG